MRYPVLALVLCGLALTAQAQIYKWKDADGSIHYSDQPPTNAQTKSKVVDVKAQSVSGYSTGARAASGAANASAPMASAPVAKVDDTKDPGKCKEATDRLNYLLNVTKLQTINEKGNVEMMDANKRAVDTAATKQNILKYCQ
ncbi:DUF4124 domain-containing protein [Amantichitinum ursilacus]|uniref:DUF4124 domain-containing protein n=1 Tax=Amantichitinum ursilacus TaxID=857265 RepID=A0A0N1JRU4_9NEIS|nr:DUF4124 domain-containing protein [Amantichitinum ursilacus]KPC50540.1 hypothetical protein WG78_17085 [Amantichitinum ursilacus]